MSEYIKLKDLVGSNFKVESVGTPVYKMWSDVDKRFVVRETWAEDFRKVYPTETNKGKLDLGSGQLGSLLEATFKEGKADLIGKIFEVKSNGKEGMDIRYFFNLFDTSPMEVSRETKPQPQDDTPPIETYEEMF